MHSHPGDQHQGQRAKEVHSGMLLDKDRSQADQNGQDHHAHLPAPMGHLAATPGHGNANGIGHVQRRAGIGRGIGCVQKLHTVGQQIVPGESRRTQLMTAGQHQEDHCADDLAQEDKGLDALKALHVMAQKVKQRKGDLQIPGHIRDHEPLAKGDQIIQRHIHDRTFLQGIDPSGQKEHGQKGWPGKQQL